MRNLELGSGVRRPVSQAARAAHPSLISVGVSPTDGPLRGPVMQVSWSRCPTDVGLTPPTCVRRPAS